MLLNPFFKCINFREIDWIEQIVTTVTKFPTVKKEKKNQPNSAKNIVQINFVCSSVKRFLKFYFHLHICLVCFCVCVFGLFT